MSGSAIGVIGLGGMGGGMANRLLDTGYQVTVWNRSKAAAEPFVARGAKLAATPGDAAACGMVITMVANDAALDSVVSGADGVLENLGDGVHISMSTVSVALVQSLAQRHAARGGHFISAPVFGRPVAAASGKLWIMQSGPEAAKARVRPVLETLSQTIHDIGLTPDAAAVGKIAGNFMIAAATEAMGEAFALLAKSGADARVWHEMISSTIFACPIYANYGRFILDRAFSPPGFKLTLGAKDIGLALEAGAGQLVPMPFANVLRDRFMTSIAQGRGEMDWTSIALNALSDAGLPV